jgi:hypothetical protein
MRGPEKMKITTPKQEIDREIADGVHEYKYGPMESSKQEELKAEFRYLCHRILLDVENKERISTEEAKELFSTLMESLIKIDNYKEDNKLLIERDKVLDAILPDVRVMEKYPKEKDPKFVGHAIEEYGSAFADERYSNPAAFSHSPLAGGDVRETGVIGDPSFYPKWNEYHEGQQLFVMPGVAKISMKTKDGKDVYERDVDSHTLRTARLASLYIDGDFFMRDEGVDENGNFPDNPGYNIYKIQKQ